MPNNYQELELSPKIAKPQANITNLVIFGHRLAIIGDSWADKEDRMCKVGLLRRPIYHPAHLTVGPLIRPKGSTWDWIHSKKKGQKDAKKESR